MDERRMKFRNRKQICNSIVLSSTASQSQWGLSRLLSLCFANRLDQDAADIEDDDDDDGCCC